VKNPARTVSLQLRRIKAPKGSVWKANNIDWKHYTHTFKCPKQTSSPRLLNLFKTWSVCMRL
jgi:hypothetical protein